MTHKHTKTGKEDSSSGNFKKIKEMEEELSKTKYNKKTQHHIGLVKAKIAKLKEKETQKAKGKGKQTGYYIKKTGDATVIILGFPSVGKSTLLNAITNAKSPVGAYDFTTLTVIPGLLEQDHAKIQILDVPGILTGAAAGTGRGKEVLAVIRNADIILIMIDATKPAHYDHILKEVYDTDVRLNQTKPDVKITKKSRGGIGVGTTVKLSWLDAKTIKGILMEFKINNADVLIRTDITPDQLIDVIEGNKEYIPSLVVLNKADLLSKEELEKVKKKMKPDVVISADKRINLDKVRKKLFEKLGLLKIFLKEISKKADMDEPLIMRKGCTIGDVCNKLHKDFYKKFTYARIWGKSAKFPGQAFRKLNKALEDSDILEIHIK
jgi:small GTP-binding protein